MIDSAARQPEPSAPSRAETTGSRLTNKSFVIYIATFFVIWSLRATVFIRVDESIPSDVGKNLYSNALKFTLWVLPVFITLALLRMKPLAYTKLKTPVNKRGLLVSSLVVFVWLSLVVVGESLIQGKSIGVLLSQKAPAWLGILAGVSLSPIWEEILFRGFFLNRLNESLSFWKSNLISAFLFMLAHAPYWISKNGFSAPVIKDLVNVFLLGCLFGWVMKKTNSLWPAIGAHIANNFLSGLIHP
jgi:membrane protease YdiL (CAAX protease family)